MSDDEDWYAEQRLELQGILNVEPDSEAAICLQLYCAAAVATLSNLPKIAEGDVEAIGEFYENESNLFTGALYPRVPATKWLKKALDNNAGSDNAPEFEDSHISEFMDQFDLIPKIWSIAVEVLDTPVDDLDFFFDQFTKNIVDSSLKMACAITTLAILVEYQLLSRPDADIYDGSAIARSAEFFNGLQKLNVQNSNPAEVMLALKGSIEQTFMDEPVREFINSILRQLGDDNVAQLLSNERLPELISNALSWWTGDVVVEVNGRYADAM